MKTNPAYKIFVPAGDANLLAGLDVPLPNRAVVGPATVEDGEAFAVGRKAAEAASLTEVARELANLLAGGRVPQCERALDIEGRQRLAVAREGERRVLRLELADGLALVHRDDADAVVFQGDEVACWSKHDVALLMIDLADL